jgi:hypothetical protein
MKYNKAYEDENFEKYLEYLDTIKDKLSKDTFEFISDPNRHDFSEQSLHDSWLKSFECSSNFETNMIEIFLTLIGANFDREFKFSFRGVSQYKIFQQICLDLITYEIGIEKDFMEEEKIIFRAMFAGEEAEIEIYAEQIEIKEKMINK